jgi:(p)ppGpp synthase/HD superfamily hydrolase
MLTGQFDSALCYAHIKHRTQVRKGTNIPYISHLLQVAGLVLEHGGNEDEAIGGLLHDVVEDTDVMPEEVEILFGKKVRDIVVACSDSTGGGVKPEWKERKLAYIAHIEHASPSVRLVSCCDKIHNARAILADYRVHGEALWDRFNAGNRDKILWYYRGLSDAFLAADRANGGEPGRAALELDRVVSEIERLSREDCEKGSSA